MKNIKLIIIVFLLLNNMNVKAQVGIGTTTPNASAKLDITSTNKGFLPPRVALTGTADVSTIASPATGLFIYNTATAGTSPSNVTPGLYYFDGSKWQRIINQQPDATIEFNQVTPTTAGVVFTPNIPANKDYVYVSNVNASQWTYNGTAYITYTPPASTAWNLAGGTSDAGSNKTGAIYRSGKVGIGTNNPGAALEVSSSVNNSSGLKFTNLKSTSPTAGGATLGVDADGNVVTVQGSSFSPSFGSSRISATINLSAGQSALLTSITLPTTGTYLVSYTMRVQSVASIANQYAVGYLSDVSTPGTPIVGTEILGAFTAGTAHISGGNYSGSYIVTTTSSNKVLYFMGIANNGGMGFIDDQNGRTQISYVKVTP